VSSTWYLSHLACPDCGGELREAGGKAACTCGFVAEARTPIDLRPQNPRPRVLTATIGATAPNDLAAIPVTRPARTYEGPPAQRDSTELFSAAMPWLRPGGRLLDLGCGPRDQATPASHLQLDYVGVDYDSQNADLLADGHSLPFRSGTFDGVLAYAVLEHLYNPALALSEIARVLRPGGVFFGCVSQGEPFHDSYFHHTAWGVLAGFRAAGLTVSRLWPSYDTLHALAEMGRYPRVIKPLIEALFRLDRALPFLAPRKFLRAEAREKGLDELHRAAGLCFVATRAGAKAGDNGEISGARG
jgi:SAM-dependent methyltransferase